MKFQKFSKTQICPRCKSTEIFRLKRVGIATRVLCKVSNYRPYWCSSCDEFFFAPRQSRPVRAGGHYPITKPDQASQNQPSAGGLTH